MSSPVGTPLLEEMYASAEESEEQMHARHVRELAEIYSVPIDFSKGMNKTIHEAQLKRRGADASDWYSSKQQAWNKQHGEPVRRKRKVVRKTKPKRKRKAKRKAKWVPRKTYLARLRKKK